LEIAFVACQARCSSAESKSRVFHYLLSGSHSFKKVDEVIQVFVIILGCFENKRFLFWPFLIGCGVLFIVPEAILSA
jgi:hypothetical protein